ncbi:MAG: hypothetical protein Q9220_001515 [cf. Caloplaca sp. 1 TL-2023]
MPSLTDAYPVKSCPPTRFSLLIPTPQFRPTMFTSGLLSRLTKSTPQPLLPVSSSASVSRSSSIPNPTILSSQTDINATLLALARQEAHLQSHIQYLLDVQSDRLLEGLGDNAAAASPAEDHTPPSSTNDNPHTQAPYTDTPTDISPAALSRSKARHGSSSSPPPTLHATRTAISSVLTDLHALKTQTYSLIDDALNLTSSRLSTITALQTKKARLEATIRALESSPAERELERLAAEDGELGREIQEVEGRLYELQARRRVVRQRLEEGRNRVEARGSSWRGELEIVEQESRAILEGKQQPLVVRLPAAKGKGAEEEGREGESVYDLPSKRRTMEMLAEYHVAAKSRLEAQRGGLDKEIEALEQGERVWRNVVKAVTYVESTLARELDALPTPLPSHHRDAVESSGGMDGDQDGMKRVLTAMAAAREKVEAALEEAERKGWKLLVVAVGAEAEALREGEGVLRRVAGMEEGGEEEEEEGCVGGSGGREMDDRMDSGGGRGMDDMIVLDGKVRNGIVEDRDEDGDDDEPGPELMLSMG